MKSPARAVWVMRAWSEPGDLALQTSAHSCFMFVYDVIGVNVFHGKIMRFHLIKRSFHIYYTTCVRACSRSFLQGPSHDFIHTAFNRFVLSQFLPHSTLIYDSVCPFCRNNLIFFPILSAVLWKIAAHFPQMLLMHMFNIQSGPVKSTIFKKECNFASPWVPRCFICYALCYWLF